MRLPDPEPRLFRKLVKYDPDQPRDWHGRWTDGDGGEASSPPAPKPARPSKRDRLIQAINARVGMPSAEAQEEDFEGPGGESDEEDGQQDPEIFDISPSAQRYAQAWEKRI